MSQRAAQCAGWDRWEIGLGGWVSAVWECWNEYRHLYIVLIVRGCTEQGGGGLGSVRVLGGC